MQSCQGVSNRKKSVVPNGIQSGQAMSEPKVFPDFEKDEGLIDMWQLQLLMTSIRASSVKW